METRKRISVKNVGEEKIWGGNNFGDGGRYVHHFKVLFVARLVKVDV